MVVPVSGLLVVVVDGCCDSCRANEGRSPYMIGWPPYHPNCRCFVQDARTYLADKGGRELRSMASQWLPG